MFSNANKLKMLKAIGIMSALQQGSESLCKEFTEEALDMNLKDSQFKEYADSCADRHEDITFFKEGKASLIELFSTVYVNCKKDADEANKIVNSIVKLYAKRIHDRFKTATVQDDLLRIHVDDYYLEVRALADDINEYFGRGLRCEFQ